MARPYPKKPLQRILQIISRLLSVNTQQGTWIKDKREIVLILQVTKIRVPRKDNSKNGVMQGK